MWRIPLSLAALAATQTYHLPPDKLAKAVAYAAARNRLHFIDAAYGILLLVLILALRLAPRFRDWAERVSRRRILQAYIVVPLIATVTDALQLPTAMYGHHLSLQFEQSIQGWGSWFWDWTKGELVGAVILGPVLWILYGVVRRSPRRWWFYCWLTTIPIVVFLLFIAPVAITPLFNRFDPLAAKQPDLVAQIQKVVARGGLEIPADRMYLMNASEKVNSVNAYVTGIGASKRVVVWDTTIQKMTTPEILFVFGHEMGHYVLGHMWLSIAMLCTMLLVFLFLGFHATHWALARWGGRWKIRGVDDWASLPVLMLMLGVFLLVAEPAQNGFSRVLEHNADIYGLEVIHGLVPDSPKVAADAFQVLGEVSLDDPNPSPFIEFWLYSHPSIRDRVRFASEYDPWGKGDLPKYVK
jgi:Zn-dependent protease with chaperone function